MLNATYAYLCLGRDEARVEELDLMLEHEDFEQRTVDARNRRAMQDLMRGQRGFIPPPKK